MSTCRVCDSKATVQDLADGQFVTCPNCGRYFVASDLVVELPKEPDWLQFRQALSATLFSHSRHGCPQTLSSVAWARQLVAYFEIVKEGWQTRAVDVLTSEPPTSDPWGEPIHAVAKELGLRREKARAFVQGLVDRVVRI